MRLLTALRVEGPLEIEQLAKRVRLHLTTVRAHLNVLLEAGLVKSRSVATARPGRPRLVFAATDAVATAGHPGSHRMLSRILIRTLQEREDGPEQATSAGRTAGRQLVDSSGPLGITRRRARVFAVLDGLGFAPRRAGGVQPNGSQALELRRCPFSDLAIDGFAIVCAAHGGLIQGAFEALGGSPASVRLVPFTSPGLCTVHFDPE